MIPDKKTTRAAGILYLLIAVCGPFSMLYVPTSLIVWGDAARTVSNILGGALLFRMGLLVDVVVILAEMVLLVLLYRMFKPVNPTLALVAAFSRLAMVVVMGMNLLNHLIVLQLLGGGAPAGQSPDQVAGLVMLFLGAHQSAVYVWQLFFACHLAFAGWLVYRSGFFPRLIGVLLSVGSLGYLLDSLQHILRPGDAVFGGFASAFLAVSIAGELGFTLWLLIRGARQRPATSIPGSGAA